jgi:hypothetical protein
MEHLEQKFKLLIINTLYNLNRLKMFRTVPTCSNLFQMFQRSKGKFRFTEQKVNFL